ncbi:MAG: hypothetical protein Q3993_02805 [Filifactor alocis]|nr:hypothetical protein [Filifactor alocis]
MKPIRPKIKTLGLFLFQGFFAQYYRTSFRQTAVSASSPTILFDVHDFFSLSIRMERSTEVK